MQLRSPLSSMTHNATVGLRYRHMQYHWKFMYTHTPVTLSYIQYCGIVWLRAIWPWVNWHSVWLFTMHTGCWSLFPQHAPQSVDVHVAGLFGSAKIVHGHLHHALHHAYWCHVIYLPAHLVPGIWNLPPPLAAHSRVEGNFAIEHP